jgi:tetratricopeptide (TPR) repeat protein
MYQKNRLVLCFFFFCLAPFSFAQSYDGAGNVAASAQARLNRGIELYAEGRWGDAIVELRRAGQEAPGATNRAEALFWIAMAEMASFQYQDAIHDFDEITRVDPLSVRRFEVPYQKARAFYYLGRYNEAIVLFTQYADSIRIDGRYINGVRSDNWYADSAKSNANDDYNRKAAAIYWIGECLFNLEQYDKAEEMLNVVIRQYAMSYKFEAATNRLALIKQKKVEMQLLDIVRRGGTIGAADKAQGAANPSAAVPANPAAYNDAVLAYKNSIAPFLMRDASKESYTPGQAQPGAQPNYPQPYPGAPSNYPGTQPYPYNPPNPPASNNPAVPGNAGGGRNSGGADPNTMMRLLTVKTQALEMMERLVSTLNAFENIESGGW